MRYKFIILFLSIILFSCKRDEDKFIGLWTIKPDTSDASYSTKLNLNKNQTFTFYGGHLTKTFNSNGNWKIINETLILRSKIPNKCFFMKKFGYICYDTKDSLKIRNRTTIPNCKPTNPNNIFMNFEDAKFVYENDSLVYIIDKFKKCPDIKLNFVIFRN